MTNILRDGPKNNAKSSGVGGGEEWGTKVKRESMFCTCVSRNESLNCSPKNFHELIPKMDSFDKYKQYFFVRNRRQTNWFQRNVFHPDEFF